MYLSYKADKHPLHQSILPKCYQVREIILDIRIQSRKQCAKEM